MLRERLLRHGPDLEAVGGIVGREIDLLAGGEEAARARVERAGRTLSGTRPNGARENLGLGFARLREDGVILGGLRAALDEAVKAGEVIRQRGEVTQTCRSQP